MVAHNIRAVTDDSLTSRAVPSGRKEYATWFTALIKDDLASATQVAQEVAAPPFHKELRRGQAGHGLCACQPQSSAQVPPQGRYLMYGVVTQDPRAASRSGRLTAARSPGHG